MLGFASSNIAMFLQWCYRYNRLGQKYIIFLRYIRTLFKTKKYKKIWETICFPLGYCSYCQSVWINIGLNLSLFLYNPIFLLISIGANFYFLEKMNK